jgi:hypothetical protein
MVEKQNNVEYILNSGCNTTKCEGTVGAFRHPDSSMLVGDIGSCGGGGAVSPEGCGWSERLYSLYSALL